MGPISVLECGGDPHAQSGRAGRRDPQAGVGHAPGDAVAAERRPVRLGRQARSDGRSPRQRFPRRRKGHRRHPRQARSIARPRAPDRLPHGFLVPAAARAQPAVDRLPCRGAATRRELLRPAGLRSAACQSVLHRQGRHPDQSLVQARPAGRRDRLQRRADVVVRLDVRVSDAAAGHEGAAWRHSQPDQPPDHQAADAVRPLQAHSMGHLGSGLQRARPRDDLPVHEFRRARPRPQARAGAQHRHCTLCDGTRRPVHATRGGGQSGTPAFDRRNRTLRLLRRRRLHAGTRARRQRPCRRLQLHGAPSGHVRGGDRQRDIRRPHARPLP